MDFGSSISAGSPHYSIIWAFGCLIMPRRRSYVAKHPADQRYVDRMVQARGEASAARAEEQRLAGAARRQEEEGKHCYGSRVRVVGLSEERVYVQDPRERARPASLQWLETGARQDSGGVIITFGQRVDQGRVSWYGLDESNNERSDSDNDAAVSARRLAQRTEHFLVMLRQMSKKGRNKMRTYAAV